jgi:hypothetical protein
MLSAKRDCNFINKSAMFESLLRISRKTKKARHGSDMRRRASAVSARAPCLFNSGLWLKLLTGNRGQTEYQVTANASA